MKIIAIHQPNFFPWLGYFDKIRRADVFALLDDVQFQKSSKGTWSNRVKLMVGGEPQWVTMPIVRAFHGIRMYREIQIDDQNDWRGKFLRTLSMNYAKAPFFKEIFQHIETMVHFNSDNLVEFNINTIRSLAENLGLPLIKMVCQSELNVSGASTDLLISITQACGGTAYLCGMGSIGYQEDKKFADARVDLIYQNFQHPIYPQISKTEFSPGLSIIDALMNCGFGGTMTLLSNPSLNGMIE